ncbi:hypothetical protein PanWU01x14_048360 [Parasponia andersonii]|uniref:Late embryogenesis abundant protein n=1 Tax=Parasponia andersonii TaxID=3476 RepID=A0A2P5DNB4_PARAD|nr:hypothetical protein PanWU01x14_048360 [Parasponia andersonii]
MEAKRLDRQFSKLRGMVLDPPEQARTSSNKLGHDKTKFDSSTTSYWTPHPHSGIYVPRGHEWVVDDVPKNAALFDQTYWLRNVDGVEKADPDLPPDHYFGHASTNSL